jgi:ribosomal protein S18 acetylase RimI-like enzyme
MFIRWIVSSDEKDIKDIESHADNPWTWEEYRGQLRKLAHIGMVAEVNDAAAGVIVYELHRGKFAVHRLIVHPRHRRDGIGRALMDKLIGKLHVTGRTRVMFDVEDDRLDMHLFLRAIGESTTSIAPSGCYRFVWRVREHCHA